MLLCLPFQTAPSETNQKQIVEKHKRGYGQLWGRLDGQSGLWPGQSHGWVPPELTPWLSQYSHRKPRHFAVQKVCFLPAGVTALRYNIAGSSFLLRGTNFWPGSHLVTDYRFLSSTETNPHQKKKTVVREFFTVSPQCNVRREPLPKSPATPLLWWSIPGACLKKLPKPESWGCVRTARNKASGTQSAATGRKRNQWRHRSSSCTGRGPLKGSKHAPRSPPANIIPRKPLVSEQHGLLYLVVGF